MNVLLLAHFAPAEIDEPRSKELSTKALFSILDEHAPGMFSAGELYAELRATGFKDRLLGEDLLWSVKPAPR